MASTAVPSGKPYVFVYDHPNKTTGATCSGAIYDLSGTPTLITTISMTAIGSTGSYYGVFTPAATAAGKNYAIVMSTSTVPLLTTYPNSTEVIEVDGFDENFGRAL